MHFIYNNICCCRNDKVELFQLHLSVRQLCTFIIMSNWLLFLNLILQCSYVLCMPLIVITNELHANFHHINLISLVSTLSQTGGFTIAPLRIMAIDS